MSNSSHDPRKPPLFVCEVCGEGIRDSENVIVAREALVTHKTCLAATWAAVDPLTADERARLIRLCFTHQVAVCGQCGRDYGVMELGADIVSGRYNLCPFCRVDLTWSIRQHIAACAVVRVTDPKWQAEAVEALARARELRKASQHLRETTELTRLESEVLQSRARRAGDTARRAKEEAERIKRSEPSPPDQ